MTAPVDWLRSPSLTIFGKPVSDGNKTPILNFRTKIRLPASDNKVKYPDCRVAVNLRTGVSDDVNEGRIEADFSMKQFAMFIEQLKIAIQSPVDYKSPRIQVFGVFAAQTFKPEVAKAYLLAGKRQGSVYVGIFSNSDRRPKIPMYFSVSKFDPLCDENGETLSQELASPMLAAAYLSTLEECFKRSNLAFEEVSQRHSLAEYAQRTGNTNTNNGGQNYNQATKPDTTPVAPAPKDGGFDFDDDIPF